MIRKVTVALFLFAIFTAPNLFAQSGKISGRVLDAATKEPLVGVNVVIQGTTIGNATDSDGYYNILNVTAGTYTLRASLIGFTPVVVENVRVNINLTTIQDFQLREESFVGDELIVTAERPIIQQDVSSSQVNVNAEEIKKLPITNVAEVVGLQAGTRGLSIRGAGSDQISFVVNGATLRDARDNSPFTGISLTAVDNIQVQTGGFSAEYGNVRSGIVNVTTKEGRRDKYTVDVIARYRAAAPKNQGQAPNDPNSYWLRPYLDPDVAFTGTKNGKWDAFTQRQYPEFEGWNAVALQTLQDDDPSNDLTPLGAQQLFRWQHRKNLTVTKPDYEIDAGIGGPIIGAEKLGNLRFFMSMRATETQYMFPLATDGYNNSFANFRITSDLKPGMKLSFDGIYGFTKGTTNNNTGNPGIFTSGTSIANQMNRVSFIDSRIYSTDYWSPSSVQRYGFGAKFTHAVSNNTFYEVKVDNFSSSYDTNPGRPRDTTPVVCFGNFCADEGPFGYFTQPSSGIGSGLRMGVGMSNSRDSSFTSTWSTKADITSQVNRWNQVKAGIEYVYTVNKVNYGSVDEYLPSGRSMSKWTTYPTRGAAYAQNKLEFKGMIANVGLRLDYSHAGGDWIDYAPFTRAFAPGGSDALDSLNTSPTKRLFYLSPRLGVSFPVTITSKLFFNYGHFRQLPAPDNLYMIRRFSDNGQLTRIADPNSPLPKTVAYELGYEQSIRNSFVARVSGYYRDAANQPALVTYNNTNGLVTYSKTEPTSYDDTRGIEVSLRKSPTRYFSGEVNYTYSIRSSGFFGLRRYYENRALQRQEEFETALNLQSKPVPQPFANLILEFYTPRNFGPKFGKQHLLGDWSLSTRAAWQSGQYLTWAGGGSIPGINNNVQWIDNHNIDMRFSKTFNTELGTALLFVDVSNVLNTRYMSQTNNGFIDGRDYEAYMKSLHLPKEIGDPLGYGNIPGNDRPGMTRKGPYIPWDENASEEQKAKWRKNKSYIDMPNQEFLNFLNPRNIFWGLRLTF
jgi:outer membrane receptor protein involved in Fe transport